MAVRPSRFLEQLWISASAADQPDGPSQFHLSARAGAAFRWHRTHELLRNGRRIVHESVGVHYELSAGAIYSRRSTPDRLCGLVRVEQRLRSFGGISATGQRVIGPFL